MTLKLWFKPFSFSSHLKLVYCDISQQGETMLKSNKAKTVNHTLTLNARIPLEGTLHKRIMGWKIFVARIVNFFKLLTLRTLTEGDINNPAIFCTFVFSTLRLSNRTLNLSALSKAGIVPICPRYDSPIWNFRRGLYRSQFFFSPLLTACSDFFACR